ncbi:MAG TPA: hypothetical protein VJI68_03285 [Candidatus Nanoarchaeia archaeon]|nr:hypothetical protein [Candidatus Nanoarchaeia archaeon]
MGIEELEKLVNKATYRIAIVNGASPLDPFLGDKIREEGYIAMERLGPNVSLGDPTLTNFSSSLLYTGPDFVIVNYKDRDQGGVLFDNLDIVRKAMGTPAHMVSAQYASDRFDILLGGINLGRSFKFIYHDLDEIREIFLKSKIKDLLHVNLVDLCNLLKKAVFKPDNKPFEPEVKLKLVSFYGALGEVQTSDPDESLLIQNFRTRLKGIYSVLYNRDINGISYIGNRPDVRIATGSDEKLDIPSIFGVKIIGEA